MNLSTDKYCKKGSHWVDKKFFYKKSQSKDGLFNCCKSCAKEEEKNSKRKIKEGTIKAF